MSFEEMCVGLNLMNLSIFLEGFRRSVELFDFLERQGAPEYREIAAKEGALNIYHFGCALRAINTVLSTHNLFGGKIDLDLSRRAGAQFRTDFRNNKNVRHAIAHAGEILESPEKVAKHPVFGAGFSGLVTSIVQNKTYSIAFEGKMFTINLDMATVSKLEAVMLMTQAAFSNTSAPNAPPAGN